MPTHDEPEYEGVPRTEYSASFRRDGRVVLVEKQEGEIAGSSPLYDTQLGDLKAALLDVAELGPDLLPALDEAITGLEEVSHVRGSLISQLLKEEGFAAEHGLLPGFVEYAREEIEDAFKSLDTLYRACTGKSLTQHRVR